MSLGCKFSWSEIEILCKTWDALAIKNNGTFVTRNVRQGNGSIDYTSTNYELRIPFANNHIILLTDNHMPLKVYFHFLHDTGCDFLIYPEDYADKLAKVFGLKEIRIGDPVFDPKFIIKGNNPDFIKRILTFELRNFLLNNFVSNFKMEAAEGASLLEMNISVKELDAVEMQNVIQTFTDCIVSVNND
jgi:hypothetical protein